MRAPLPADGNGASRQKHENHDLYSKNADSAQVFHNAAVRLARAGLAVFPLAPGSRVPLAGSHGFHDASTDPEVAAERWAQCPRANIGIATGPVSGIWILDVDPQHDGDLTLAEVEDKHGTLPHTIAAATPSGGRHLYWRWPANSPVIRNSAGQIGPGIDVRGRGGYALAPPSVLADGRAYRWVSGGLVEAPDWLVRLAAPPKPPPAQPKPISGDVSAYVGKAVSDELRALSEAPEGSRNDQLNRTTFALAGLVKAGALDGDWLRQELERHAVEIGLSIPETRATIASAFRAASPRRLS